MKKLTNNPYLSFLLVVAFVIKIMLPFWAVNHIVQAIEPFEDSVLDIVSFDEGASNKGKILLCTGNGFKWVSLQSLLEEEEQPQKQHTHYDCALCYASCHHLYDVISIEGFTFRINRTSPSVFGSYLNILNIQEGLSHRIQARAPPHLA